MSWPFERCSTRVTYRLAEPLSSIPASLGGGEKKNSGWIMCPKGTVKSKTAGWSSVSFPSRLGCGGCETMSTRGAWHGRKRPWLAILSLCMSSGQGLGRKFFVSRILSCPALMIGIQNHGSNLFFSYEWMAWPNPLEGLRNGRHFHQLTRAK